MVRVESASEGDRLHRCAALFDEYARSIAHLAGESLAHQGFEHELAGLPGAYAPPAGGRSLAVWGQWGADGVDAAVGCIAFRPMRSVDPAAPADECELKRMYVRPECRGRGVARALVERVLIDARAAGYRLMRLDTSGSMDAAIALYRSMGFAPCERYNDDPMPDTLYFQRVL
ncbi:MAG: GNAT family N-acetyltransferase [Phycisphaerales bacterium]